MLRHLNVCIADLIRRNSKFGYRSCSWLSYWLNPSVVKMWSCHLDSSGFGYFNRIPFDAINNFANNELACLSKGSILDLGSGADPLVYLHEELSQRVFNHTKYPYAYSVSCKADQKCHHLAIFGSCNSSGVVALIAKNRLR